MISVPILVSLGQINQLLPVVLRPEINPGAGDAAGTLSFETEMNMVGCVPGLFNSVMRRWHYAMVRCMPRPLMVRRGGI